ncbi:MAG: ABC transporter permease [Xenococcaceae cyanobacterium MO_167.B27]|nr:ABC transporter permease [Xenococcaceae cyanobacterium MO_167.B27]
MKRILSQCQKELAQFRRDRLTLALAFILPLMTLLIFGFAIRLEAKNIPLFIQDFDLSPLSRSYIERLFATNQFTQASSLRFPIIDSEDNKDYLFRNPQQAIDEGIAKATVVIPTDFSRRIKDGLSSDVQVLVDGSDANNARVIQNIIKATTKDFLSNYNVESSPDKIMPRVRIWFNPGRKESFYIIPGLFALILWVYPSALTSFAMVREKEQGTILQVYASSLNNIQLLLGKGLAYLLIGLGQALFILLLGSLIWGLSLVGDPTPLLIGTPIFLADSVLFGLLVGVGASNLTAAIQGVTFLGFLTALLLSGFIYPLNNIPFPLSFLSNVIPARYYIEITRDAYVRGTGWSGVWLAMLMLVVLGLFLFNVARLRLKRMQLSD